MNDVLFKSLNELYNRIFPALNTKKNEMLKFHLNITETEIWYYFKDNVWKEKKDLTLHEMVSDILNTDNLEIYQATKNKID